MEEEEYFKFVEDYFIQKRGNPMLLSPKEWALIREWHESGIPGEVVLRAIDRGFEKKKKEENEPTLSLTYFRRIVKSEYKRFLKAQEGITKTEPLQQESTNIEEFLNRLINDLQQSSEQAKQSGNHAMAELLVQCRGKLVGEVLKPFLESDRQNLQRVEHQLTTLEKEIEKVLLQTISDSQLTQFREDAMRDLKSFEDKIELPVYQEMITRALIKSVRKLYSIPRLSLFYM